MARHRHASLIKAWADGSQIQVKGCDGWEDTINPQWLPNHEYRVKPTAVKKSGWIIVCKHKKTYASATIYCCKEEAEANRPVCGVAIVPIEWEEEL